MKLKKSCSTCIKGTPMGINNDILCRSKGAVSPDYSCSGHRNSPSLKTFKEMDYKCFNCGFFIPDNSGSDDSVLVGLCHLFSVRKYDGKKRSACSKFAKKTASALDVS